MTLLTSPCPSQFWSPDTLVLEHLRCDLINLSQPVSFLVPSLEVIKHDHLYCSTGETFTTNTQVNSQLSEVVVVEEVVTEEKITDKLRVTKTKGKS